MKYTVSYNNEISPEGYHYNQMISVKLTQEKFDNLKKDLTKLKDKFNKQIKQGYNYFIPSDCSYNIGKNYTNYSKFLLFLAYLNVSLFDDKKIKYDRNTIINISITD